MSDKQVDDKDDSKRIGPGDLLSFGSVKLLFTLNLDKTDLSNHNIKWEELESLSNLQFLRENKNLWKRVVLSSTNDTLSILLQINKSSKKLVKIGYVGFKKITYKDDQVDFYDFVEEVTRQNGLFITSCDVCKSVVSMQLLLKYKNKQKIFLLSGQSTTIIKEEKKDKDKNDKNNKKKEKEKGEDNKNNEENEKKEEENKVNNNNNEDMKQEKENKSEEEDQENPLANITDDVIKPSEFNYIYVNYGDYYSGEFNGRVKFEHLYEYFQHLKTTTKSLIDL